MDDDLKLALTLALRHIETFQTAVLAPMSALLDDIAMLLSGVRDGKGMSETGVDPDRVIALRAKIAEVNTDVLSEKLDRALGVFLDAVERGEIAL